METLAEGIAAGFSAGVSAGASSGASAFAAPVSAAGGAGGAGGLDPLRAALRALPRVDDLLGDPVVAEAAQGIPHATALDTVRACLDDERARIKAGQAPRTRDQLREACVAAVDEAGRPHLRPLVNATGTVMHTNLGRAPLSAHAAARVADIAMHYSTLEFDVEAGQRGSRHDHVRDLVCRLTGAEDAAVVNNNAAAVMLVLSEFARGREAVVSRGELIEIGGSFRIPDIMAASGARMVEVGTTNKTHLVDFERAMGPETSVVLKVHPSNYRVVGFSESVDVRELTQLAHERGVLVYEDQGSGTLVDLDGVVPGAGEHTPAWSVSQGVDLVSFSGDKLLGAGQAGIVVGSAKLVGRLKKNPLMRAFRPDKMTLAALEATLADYLDPGVAWERVPVLHMIAMGEDELLARAGHVRDLALGMLGAGGPAEGETAGEDGCAAEPAAEGCAAPAAGMLRVARTTSCVGGGALPTKELPGWAVELAIPGTSPDDLRRRLLDARPRPVVARVSHDALVCDVRTLVDARDEEDLARALAGLIAAAGR